MVATAAAISWQARREHSCLLSFGHFTPVFALAYLLFPPLTVVRYPVKLLVLVTMLLAILAGWGFDALRSPDSPWKTQAAGC